MLSEESRIKVEKLVGFGTGVFNTHRPADFYIYYHPTLYLFDSFESWAAEEQKIKQHNIDAKYKLDSKVYKMLRSFNIGEEPELKNSLTEFDKKSPYTSGTFKVGVTNSSAKLTKEEREYLNELKRAVRNLGFRPYKIQFSRNRDHKLHGWTRIKHLKFDLGEQALFVEREILKWVRQEMQSKPHLTKKHLPQSGWTETINASEINFLDMLAKVKELTKINI